MPCVSLVIPVYNAASFVRETLDGIRAQTFQDMEVICVDDVSTDNSVAVIEEFGGIHVIRRSSNSGLASAPRNDGVRAAQGEFIAFCDADDVMLPGKIAAQVEFLRSHPSVDFCCTDFVDFDEAGTKEAHTSTCLELQRALGPDRRPGQSHVLPSKEALRVLVDENFVGASTMFFRRELTDSIGLFREDIRGSEDIDFVLRAAARGPIGFVDIVGHRRRLHDGNVTRNHKRMLISQSQVLRDRYGIAQDEIEKRRLRARISCVYESLAYLLRMEHSVKSSLQMALMAAKWDASRMSAYREIAKAAVAPWIALGARRDRDTA